MTLTTRNPRMCMWVYSDRKQIQSSVCAQGEESATQVESLGEDGMLIVLTGDFRHLQLSKLIKLCTLKVPPAAL